MVISALFQSLLLEACRRTMNPVNGAVGLLWTGNWNLCQSAVTTVLQGRTVQAMPELVSAVPTTNSDDASEAVICCSDDKAIQIQESDLQFGLTRSGLNNAVRRSSCGNGRWTKKLRTMPSLEVSETTTMESGTDSASSQTKLLQLFL
ncbi:putative transcription factor AS2-LOB family [Helianthus debilis subsp. tardiflorus]